MKLVMRATIAIAVATALAVYILTPSVASASNDAGSPAAVVGTGDLAGVQEEVQAGQSTNQDEMQAEQSGDQAETQVEQSGAQGDQQADQSGEQS